MKKIEIKCKGSDNADYKDLLPFQGNLKVLTVENYEKLKNNIIKHGFSFPIAIWKNGNRKFILDGHHRLMTVKKLVEEEGYQTDPLPIIDVEAETIKEAKEKLLSASSQYATMDKQGLYEFLSSSEITLDDLNIQYNFPDIDLMAFEREYFADLSSTASDPLRDKASADAFPGVSEDDYLNRTIRTINLVYLQKDYETLLNKMDKLLERRSFSSYPKLVEALVHEEDNRTQA